MNLLTDLNKGNTMCDEYEDTGQAHRTMLEILVCPVTRGTLKYDRKRQELISPNARLAFPIRNGIPIMLTDEARHPDLDEPERKSPNSPKTNPSKRR